MTRYEFASGLSACLESINQLIQSATGTVLTQEDINILQRLQDEFAAELASLRDGLRPAIGDRIDNLQVRTSHLYHKPIQRSSQCSSCF